MVAVVAVVELPCCQHYQPAAREAALTGSCEAERTSLNATSALLKLHFSARCCFFSFFFAGKAVPLLFLLSKDGHISANTEELLIPSPTLLASPELAHTHTLTSVTVGDLRHRLDVMMQFAVTCQSNLFPNVQVLVLGSEVTPQTGGVNQDDYGVSGSAV